ncbi:PEP-CTERM sorting domain-containing protein [Duganella sp. BJB1802]|uniref:PEP-CTERM sorting domain-containing protein n=1 Tax=Duganella sp. BJB1802 TaxID=2744575 RepID=UPI0015944CAA|nr:PEP-CTERM sorting domain-containing protein [Duganella sp. BJB1802]NVD70341.1 PEP-CTERM sorting domain-containing protein [Duganella sp. BJB1802]
MQNIIPKLTLSALMAVASFAQASTFIDTPAFSISYVDGSKPSQWNIGLMDTTAGSATFAMNTLNRQLSNAYAGPNGTLENEANAYHYSVFHIDVHDGYRISNLTFSGVANGMHHSYWQPGEQPGFADNSLDLRWNVTGAEGGNRVLLSDKSLDGGYTFRSQFGAINYGNSFDLALNGWVWAYVVQSADGKWGPTSQAAASIYDTALTIDYAEIKSPVPEPTTGAMLLGGLALLACVARRRAAKQA